MCKVTRNVARSGVVSVRQSAPHTHSNAHSRAHTESVSHNHHVDHPHQTIHGKVEVIGQKLPVLPHNPIQKTDDFHGHARFETETHSSQANAMVVEVKEKKIKDESSSSFATPAVLRPAAANIGGLDGPNSSLRAISALCLPQAPNVVPGALIRECLLGQVSMGSYALGNNKFLPVVVKEFHLQQVLNKTTKNGQRLHEDALTELQIHAYIQKKQLRNVIGLYAMYLNLPTNKLFAYLEYAAKGELFSLLQARGSPLPLLVSCNFFVQLLQGIADLHSVNVVHRDLSLENVLVTADNEVKICDFGLATICAAGVNITDGRAVGKVKYMCPEVYYGEEYDARLADVWSVAVIFFLMLTNVFPYERPSAEDPRLVMICHGQINQLLAHWQRPALDEEMLQLFSHMFCPPQERWSAMQILQLPFCQRFAKVSKTDIAKALEPQANAASANRQVMPAEQCPPSVHSSANSQTTASPSLESRLSPASEGPSASFSEWFDPGHCQFQASSPNCPSDPFSVSQRTPGSFSSTAHCQSYPLAHVHSEPFLAQQNAQMQMQVQQFHTPAVIAEGRK